jgi:hypothetical protein
VNEFYETDLTFYEVELGFGNGASYLFHKVDQFMKNALVTWATDRNKSTEILRVEWDGATYILNRHFLCTMRISQVANG